MMETTMNRYFTEQKSRILSYLRRFLEERSRDLDPVNRWGPDACRLLTEFTASGKMIRGGLVILAWELFYGEPSADRAVSNPPPESMAVLKKGAKAESALAAATALELFQSALLIHDDIIDRDTMRRGQPSLFYQYHNRGLSESLGSEAYHFGESMGICLGDLAFFLGFEILAAIDEEPSVLNTLLRLFSRELTLVGLGQMEDVYLGKVHQRAREADILNVYRYKTSRYTFSLPLVAGAILGGAPPPVLADLEKLGENLGIIFQIKDDELGLFGSAATIGKPVGSDLKEGKMTLYMYHLLQDADPELAGWLQTLQNAAVSEADLARIRDLVISNGIQARITGLTDDLTAEVRLLMAALPFQSPQQWAILSELVEYNLSRNQ